MGPLLALGGAFLRSLGGVVQAWQARGGCCWPWVVGLVGPARLPTPPAVLLPACSGLALLGLTGAALYFPMVWIAHGPVCFGAFGAGQ